jgi:MacB-like periplasmic core domain
LLKSFFLLRSVDAGFDPHNVLTMQLTLPKTKYPSTETQNAFVQQALEQIRTLPEVESVAATIDVPLVGAWGVGYSVKGEGDVPGQTADWANVTPNYFRTMRIPLLKGRSFTEQHTGERPPVTVISAPLARKHFPNQDPIGSQISVNGEREIVGVVGEAIVK